MSGPNYDYRCKDRNCNGLAQLKKNGEFKVKKICSLIHEKHNYIIRNDAINKLKAKEFLEADMKKIEFQEAYFIKSFTDFPYMDYNTISINFLNAFNVPLLYTNRQFNNYKSRLVKSKDLEIAQSQLLTSIEYDGENLLKKNYEYRDNENKIQKIKIFGTTESLSLLKAGNIKQYFIDATYKVLPFTKEFKALVILMGYNYEKNTYILLLAALFSEQTEDIYRRFYNILSNNYAFNPKIMSFDFGMANLSAFTKIYPKTTIITCFFHLVQTWMRNATKFGLKKKKYNKLLKLVIIKMKRLAFLDYESSLYLYQNIKQIKQIKDNDNFNDFFKYFEKTWFPVVNKKDKTKTKDSKFKFSLWNYNGKFDYESTSGTLLAKNQLELYVSFSNNCCESLNTLLKTFAPLNKNFSIPLFKNIIISIFARTNAK